MNRGNSRYAPFAQMRGKTPPTVQTLSCAYKRNTTNRPPPRPLSLPVGRFLVTFDAMFREGEKRQECVNRTANALTPKLAGKAPDRQRGFHWFPNQDNETMPPQAHNAWLDVVPTGSDLLFGLWKLPSPAPRVYQDVTILLEFVRSSRNAVAVPASIRANNQNRLHFLDDGPICLRIALVGLPQVRHILAPFHMRLHRRSD